MIKTKRTSFILHLLIIIFWLSTLYLWNNRPVFVGNRTKTSDCYILQFEEMNQTDSHVLMLEKDDVLSVEYSIEKGKMDFYIGQENEKPIYKGNDIAGGKFEVTVPENGTYQISVKAKHASGNISIMLLKNVTEQG